MNKDDLTGGSFNDYPNDQYKKFFEKFSEINTIKCEEWKPVHLLAYFVSKYSKHYQTNYSFKYNNPAPSKCFEIFQVKRLASMLSSKPNILKEYIDWIFEQKIIKAKRRITSISFLTKEDNVKDYKLNVLFNPNQIIDRTTNLPDNYKSLFSEIGTKVNNYGELAFLYQMTDMPFEMVGAFQKLEASGFDLKLLENIL
jgi:hypothetical protein